MEKVIAEKKYPIHLMFGIGNNLYQGFSVVYETPDGGVGSRNVWYENDTFNERTKFTDEESYIVIETVEKGTIFKETETRVKEISINRNFMKNT